MKSERNLLLRQIRRLYGVEMVVKAEEIILNINKPEVLEIIADYIVDSQDAEELLSTLEEFKK